MKAPLLQEHIGFVDQNYCVPCGSELVEHHETDVGQFVPQHTLSIPDSLVSSVEGNVDSSRELTMYRGLLRCSATASAVRVFPVPGGP
jgi:hypothetical protein